MKEEIVTDNTDYLKRSGTFVNRNDKEYLQALARRKNNITLESLQLQINSLREEIEMLKTKNN